MQLALALSLPAIRTPGEGGADPDPGFTPSLDFSDLRNSQYLAALMEDI